MVGLDNRERQPTCLKLGMQAVYTAKLGDFKWYLPSTEKLPQPGQSHLLQLFFAFLLQAESVKQSMDEFKTQMAQAWTGIFVHRSLQSIKENVVICYLFFCCILIHSASTRACRGNPNLSLIVPTLIRFRPEGLIPLGDHAGDTKGNRDRLCLVYNHHSFDNAFSFSLITDSMCCLLVVSATLIWLKAARSHHFSPWQTS